jgi:hypothetical protein
MDKRCFCGYTKEEVDAAMKKAEENPSYRGEPYPKSGGGCTIC